MKRRRREIADREMQGREAAREEESETGCRARIFWRFLARMHVRSRVGSRVS